MMKSVLVCSALLAAACGPPSAENYVGTWSLSEVGVHTSNLMTCGELTPVPAAEVIAARSVNDNVELRVSVPDVFDACVLTASTIAKDPYGRHIDPTTCRRADVTFAVDHGVVMIDGDRMHVAFAFTANDDTCAKQLSLDLQRTTL